MSRAKTTPEMTPTPEKWARFALALAEVRDAFPEYGSEIERFINETGRRRGACGDPNCTCGLSAENFRRTINPNDLAE